MKNRSSYLQRGILIILMLLLAHGNVLQAQDEMPEPDTLQIDTAGLYSITDSLIHKQLYAQTGRFQPDGIRAMWLALVFPGGGQIYNRKYWKLPIFYGGFLGCAYALTWNNQMLRDLSLPQLLQTSSDKGYTRVFETDPSAGKYYWKQILSGMFITITMTGLDQDMMQKNLTCKSLRAAQKNVITSSLLFIVVNILFLCLGAALITYADVTGFALPVNEAGAVVGDKIFPAIAFHLSDFTAIVFVLGMVAAGYSSADGTLTALTTTFCYDFLSFDKNTGEEGSQRQVRIRRMVHVGFALLYLLVIIAFRPFHTQSLIDTLFDIAGFTYGPLLGLYTFGLFTRRKVRDRWVPLVAVISPVVCYLLKIYMPQLTGYHFGFELLLVNGLLTFLGLLAFSTPSNQKQ